MTTMSDFGEKAFLRSLLPTLSVDPSFVNGFGHDASIIDLGLEKLIAFKIDRAPFPVAIRRGINDYKSWGRLAVVANVSDLLAVGAIPHAIMLSLVLPGDFNAQHAMDIIKGCEEACEIHGVAFLGGDTKEGPAPQVVGAALGTIEKNLILGRNSAKPGDRLFIAGELGGFAGTISLMDMSDSTDPLFPQWKNLITNPSARTIEARYLRESRKVVAACDLSDGLADALDIFCSDGVGITLEEIKFPMHSNAIDASKLRSIPLWRFAMGVGDWAIACVVRDEDADQFRSEACGNLVIHEVGRFNESEVRLIRDSSGVDIPVPLLINEHFRKRLEDDAGYMNELLKF